uniref:Tudor domain-containing protein n=2 Tax=Aplanochytrium stocchinoi TaxID=215587 RepID=A0A7S3V2L2_9STRA
MDRIHPSVVCTNWLKASKSPWLFIWVRSPPRVFSSNELITVSTPVQCLYQQGEVWYPGVVSNVYPSGMYRITYTDGAMEYNVARCYLRRDVGERFTVINPSGDDDSPPIKVFNKIHCSTFGCGILPPEPMQVNTLNEALISALPASTIVLSTGIHESQTAVVPPFPIRIIGEKRLYRNLNLFAKAAGMMWNDQLKRKDAGRTTPTVNVNDDVSTVADESASLPGGSISGLKLLKRKATGDSFASGVVKKPKLHPLHDITVVGVEANILPTIIPDSSIEKMQTPVCSNRYPAPFDQASVVHLVNGPLLVEGFGGNLKLEGIAFKRAKAKKEHNNDSENYPHCLQVCGPRSVYASQCTFSNWEGLGSCILVENAKALLCLQNSLICDSSRSGVMLLQGKLVCFKVEICANGKAGIIVYGGSIICWLSYIHGNIGPAISMWAPPNFFRGLITGNVMIANSEAIQQHPLFKYTEDVLTIENNVVEEDEEFVSDPYDIQLMISKSTKKRRMDTNTNTGKSRRHKR